MPQQINLFNPGCPLVALGTDSDAKENLAAVVKFGIQCGFRVLNIRDDTGVFDLVISSINSLISGGFLDRKDIFIILTIAKISSVKQIEKQIMSYISASLWSYIDLLIIQKTSTTEKNLVKIWRILENLVMQKIIKNIGLSGFSVEQMEQLFHIAVMKPFAVQARLNPVMADDSIRDFCRAHDVLLIAMSPFLRGELLSNLHIIEIAGHYNVTPAQVLLAWAIQKQSVPVVQTLDIDHIKENIMVSDLKLSEKDMGRISSLKDL